MDEKKLFSLYCCAENTIDKGKLAEKIAAEYLIKQKYSILFTNYRNRIGEIDIIADFQKKVVFVEVKSSNTYKYSPLDKITAKKCTKIRKTAHLFLHYKKWLNKSVAFEVVAVDIKKQKIQHFTEEFLNF